MKIRLPKYYKVIRQKFHRRNEWVEFTVCFKPLVDDDLDKLLDILVDCMDDALDGEARVLLMSSTHHKR